MKKLLIVIGTLLVSGSLARADLIMRPGGGSSRPQPPQDTAEFVGTIKQVDVKAAVLSVDEFVKTPEVNKGKQTTRTFKFDSSTQMLIISMTRKPFLEPKDLVPGMAVRVTYAKDAKLGMVAKRILVTDAIVGDKK